MVFRYPLANRRAKSRLQQSGLAIRQQLLRIKNLEEDIMAQVRSAARDVLTNAQRVQASRAASRAATWRRRADEAGGLASRNPQKGSRPMAQAVVGDVARAPAVPTL